MSNMEEQNESSIRDRRSNSRQTQDSNDIYSQQSNQRSTLEEIEPPYAGNEVTADERQSVEEVDPTDQNTTNDQLTENRVRPVVGRDDSILELASFDAVLGLGTQIELPATNGQATPPAAANPAQTQSSFTTLSPMRVALSYHGETNQRVKVISQLIHDNISNMESPYPVFYAPNFQTQIARLDGIRTLQRIYQQAEMVVVFLSNTYHNSRFCYNEWRAIKDRFFVGCEEQQYDRLLLVRLGDFAAGDLGLFADDFHIDGTTMTDELIAEIIVSRWRAIEQANAARMNDILDRSTQVAGRIGALRRTTGYTDRWAFIPPQLSLFLFLLSLFFFILSFVFFRSSRHLDLD